MEKSKAIRLRKKIFKLFSGKPYLGETVVTICNDIVTDSKGRNRPFLRLVNSCQEHTKEIMDLLKTLNMDIERGKLEEFYSPEEEQETEEP